MAAVSAVSARGVVALAGAKSRESQFANGTRVSVRRAGAPARARLSKSTLQVRIRPRRREVDYTVDHLAPFSRAMRPYRRRAVLAAARPGRHPFGINSFRRFARM